MVNSKILMFLSAAVLGLIGICLIFLPNEIANIFGIGSSKFVQLIIQLLGAAYFAFAILNWMTKDKLIGGIYNRPILVGNFTNFFIGGITLIKIAPSIHQLIIIWSISIFYLFLALSFGLLFFRHPITNTGQ